MEMCDEVIDRAYHDSDDIKLIKNMREDCNYVTGQFYEGLAAIEAAYTREVKADKLAEIKSNYPAIEIWKRDEQGKVMEGFAKVEERKNENTIKVKEEEKKEKAERIRERGEGTVGGGERRRATRGDIKGIQPNYANSLWKKQSEVKYGSIDLTIY